MGTREEWLSALSLLCDRRKAQFALEKPLRLFQLKFLLMSNGWAPDCFDRAAALIGCYLLDAEKARPSTARSMIAYLANPEKAKLFNAIMPGVLKSYSYDTDVLADLEKILGRLQREIDSLNYLTETRLRLAAAGFRPTANRAFLIHTNAPDHIYEQAKLKPIRAKRSPREEMLYAAATIKPSLLKIEYLKGQDDGKDGKKEDDVTREQAMKAVIDTMIAECEDAAGFQEFVNFAAAVCEQLGETSSLPEIAKLAVGTRPAISLAPLSARDRDILKPVGMKA